MEKKETVEVCSYIIFFINSIFNFNIGLEIFY